MTPLKVLIPTDFSVQAEYAWILVSKLAKKLPMEVHFLHVLNMPETVTLSEDGKVETCGEIDVRFVESQKAIAERKLDETRHMAGTEVRTHLRFGKATDTILSFAESQSFDLIAMGTKGSWGVKEKLSGSETQMVARKSRIPVLSLMCDRSDLEINNLLLVHDFTDPNPQEMALLRNVKEAFQPVLHLLQIQKQPGEEQTAKIESAMSRFASIHQLGEVEKHILQDNDVENGVIHFNQMHDMDLICMGTHGKGGLLHSSATEKLINHMFKPIISFHLN
ncbi:MAG: universal stress protein [Flavobacteriales bacterium]|jgi:nucleotide-binding universal stress UspA family protein